MISWHKNRTESDVVWDMQVQNDPFDCGAYILQIHCCGIAVKMYHPDFRTVNGSHLTVAERWTTPFLLPPQ